MKVSLNTVKAFTNVDLPVDELVAKINAQLGGVEETVNLGERYEYARIVRVVECEKHPNADKLNVCLIDDGGAQENVERTKDGYVQVVCGASNVRTGLMVVWLPPGSTVPASFEDTEPFVLGSRELRGVMSHGMLASPKELGLGDSHEGILEIDPAEKRVAAEIKPGASFARVYGLDDTTIVIENKMFTHRPDCFGQLGVAREIAGIEHRAFSSPAWYRELPKFESGDGLELTVKNDASSKVQRFMAVAVKDVTVRSSPLWLQAELVRLGGKPINNVVDVTNYIMLMTGQPLHAYDYDKLRSKHLGTRFAEQGEKVTLLNGKQYNLSADDVVIVDGDGPVGLGGVMGGGDSEVSNLTKNIVLECATFDMYAIRKTSMRHGLFTDAVTRFNKGQSPLQNEYILSLALQTVFETAGGTLASQVFDAHGTSMSSPKPVEVSRKFINERLGLDLSSSAIATLLTNVEFAVDLSGRTTDASLKITAPYWRTDIELPEDIVEEVGRLYGFDKLPRELPRRTMSPASASARLVLKERLRESLARAGGNEVLTYSFVHERLLVTAGQKSEDAFKLGNALSPELQYYRLSLLPSLLDKVHANIKNGYDEFVLFEIGKSHHKKDIARDGLPNEAELLEMVYASKRTQQGAAYYQARRYVEQLCKDMSLEVSFETIEKQTVSVDTAPFDKSRSAYVCLADGRVLGIVGELRREVRRGFKLPDYTAAAALDIALFEDALRQTTSSYRPLSRFPSVSQDLSLKVATNVNYSLLIGEVQDNLQEMAGSFHVVVKPLTIYRAKEDIDHKTVTWRFVVTSFSGTLTDKQVSLVLDNVADRLHSTYDAQRV